MVELATEGLKPDLTLLFDLPVHEGTVRTGRRSDKQSVDRLDSEDIEFYDRVRKAYLQIAANEPERVRVIDTSGPVEETHAQVKEIVVPFLESRGVKLKTTNRPTVASSRRTHC